MTIKKIKIITVNELRLTGRKKQEEERDEGITSDRKLTGSGSKAEHLGDTEENIEESAV